MRWRTGTKLSHRSTISKAGCIIGLAAGIHHWEAKIRCLRLLKAPPETKSSSAHLTKAWQRKRGTVAKRAARSTSFRCSLRHLQNSSNCLASSCKVWAVSSSVAYKVPSRWTRAALLGPGIEASPARKEPVLAHLATLRCSCLAHPACWHKAKVLRLIPTKFFACCCCFASRFAFGQVVRLDLQVQILHLCPRLSPREETLHLLQVGLGHSGLQGRNQKRKFAHRVWWCRCLATEAFNAEALAFAFRLGTLFARPPATFLKHQPQDQPPKGRWDTQPQPRRLRRRAAFCPPARVADRTKSLLNGVGPGNLHQMHNAPGFSPRWQPNEDAVPGVDVVGLHKPLLWCPISEHPHWRVDQALKVAHHNPDPVWVGQQLTTTGALMCSLQALRKEMTNLNPGLGWKEWQGRWTQPLKELSQRQEQQVKIGQEIVQDVLDCHCMSPLRSPQKLDPRCGNRHSQPPKIGGHAALCEVAAPRPSARQPPREVRPPQSQGGPGP